jgi:hypothetical protein
VTEDRNKLVNKKDRDRRRRYKRGKVYGGEVEEEEEEDERDEHEAHKPARVFDEPLKKPQRAANSDCLVFLKRYAKDSDAKYSDTQQN